MKPLNPRQLRFVQLHLGGMTATDAYANAGYLAIGKSAKSAGSRLLEHPGVKAEIARHRRAAFEATGVTAGWALAHLKVLAEYDGPGSSHLARVLACKAVLEHLRTPAEPPPAAVTVTVATVAARIERYEVELAGGRPSEPV